MDADRFFMATLRDIPEQKRIAGELKPAQASLEAIFDNISAAIYLRDRPDNLVMINTWGMHFLGCEAKQMIGQPMWKFRELNNTKGARVADPPARAHPDCP